MRISTPRYLWYQPERIFALLDVFYPYTKANPVVRPSHSSPCLTFAPG
jgi:hypothetical protein